MKRKVPPMPPRAPKLVGAYEQLQEIGRGTYGTVYAGVKRGTAERVAIKKVLGRAGAAQREAALLQRCRGADHIVQVLDVVERGDKLFLVLEYMESDLEAVIRAREQIPALGVARVKAYVQQLLRGVRELHARNVLHRDLKPNNLLLSASGAAKITDLGMATLLEPRDDDGGGVEPHGNAAPSAATDCAKNGHDSGEDAAAANPDAAPPVRKKRSIQVVTRAYRAPELFFGQDEYGAEVDMWSVGCIFAELLLRAPLFDGASDIDQLSLIFQALGSPSENGWAAAAALPFYLRFKDTSPPPLKEQLPAELSDAGVELLRAMLQLDPAKRISVDAALAHAFFTEVPRPAAPSELEIPDDPRRALPAAAAAAADDAAAAGPPSSSRAAVAPVVVSDESEGAVMIKGRRLL